MCATNFRTELNVNWPALPPPPRVQVRCVSDITIRLMKDYW